METRTQITLDDARFEHVAGIVSMLVGVGGLAYSIAFVTAQVSDNTAARSAAAILLMVTSLAATIALTGVYSRIRLVAPALALWALLLGVVAAIGAAAHGGFDLANLVHDPGIDLGDLPNTVDPRGLLTFGIPALPTFVVGWLIARSGVMPHRLGTVGMALGALLLALYLGRLIIFDAKNPLVLALAVLTGFIVNPVWWIWLGTELRKRLT